MYSFQNIDLHFGENQIFDDVSIVLTPGEKVALLGRNGAGKTTLFKIINRELVPDKGNLSVPSGKTIGYLSQHLSIDENKTIMESCLECFESYFKIEKRLDAINSSLQTEQDESQINRLLTEHADLSQQLINLQITNPQAEIEKVLKGFGFRQDQINQDLSTLSGGWQMRVEMAKLLLNKPDLLLLDEPDNHLDIEALIWFENYLKNYPGAVFFISHDVDFMSNVANRIVELANKKVHDYKMSYKKYLSAKSIRVEKETQAFANQQKIIKDKERTIKRFMAKATKTKMAQSMQKQLDKMERIELESEDITNIKIKFPVVGTTGKIVSTVKDCTKYYDDLCVFKKVSIEIERGQKVAFVGQNGQGKSTLVKIIADRIPYNEGKVNLGHNVILNYFAQDQAEALNNKHTVLETIETECDPECFTQCRNILGAFGFSGEDVEKKVSVLSGGEKSRLAMACLTAKKSNFLILDEPTNHLDINAKAILKQAIIDYPGTLVIVSHDRDILRGTVDTTYEFREKKVIMHLGDLDYVLEKRKVDDVREFSRSSEETKTPQKQEKKSDLSYEERKKINRNISRIEKKIDALEKEIVEKQNKLMDADFFKSEEGQKSIRELPLKEKELEKMNEEWDVWVTKLED